MDNQPEGTRSEGTESNPEKAEAKIEKNVTNEDSHTKQEDSQKEHDSHCTSQKVGEDAAKEGETKSSPRSPEPKEESGEPKKEDREGGAQEGGTVEGVKTETNESRRPKLRSGSAEAQGDRNTMEDTHVHIDDLHATFPEHKNLRKDFSYAFYGVYDGHGGRQTAELAQKIVHKNLVDSEKFKEGDFEAAIKDSFALSDTQILEKASQEQWTTNGCTVVSCLLVNNELYLGNLGDAELVSGQVGDSGAVIGIQLTEKHKASGEKEKERIKKLGGVVIYGRIFGTLAVSRSFGDAEFKVPKTGANFVSSEPFLKKIDLVPDVHQFLIIACDGLWDVVKYQEAADVVTRGLKEGKDPTKISESLVEEALKNGTQDNVTVVVVLFDWA